MINKLCAALFIFVMSLPAAEARADITITPKRVVFQARDRSAEVTLLNTTDSPKTYRFGWQMMKATPDGKYQKLLPYNKDTDKDPHSVANMVVFSPRQVTIEPHGHQKIRLSLRRPSGLPPGEYRAHFGFTRLAEHGPPQQKQADPDAKTISMEIDVNLSFSIPVIVRQGEDKELKVSLSDPKLRLDRSGAVLEMNINRDAGTFSSYGTVNVYWQPSGGGAEKLVGTLNNVALYPELKSRQVSVPISSKESVSTGNLRVVYSGQLEAEGIKWAEKIFRIAQ